MLGIAVYHINEVMTCRRNLSSKKVHYCRYSVPPLTFGCTFLGYRTPTITVDNNRNDVNNFRVDSDRPHALQLALLFSLVGVEQNDTAYQRTGVHTVPLWF